MARTLVKAFIVGIFALAIFLYVAAERERTQDKQRAQQINCVNNLKQMGLSFRTFALDCGDQYPFNASTNAGGSMELCGALDRDGFDSNGFLHLMVMSNELSTTKILICPKDKATKWAEDFSHLTTGNVTYLIRSGTNLSEVNPTNILAVCPVDGNVLYCGGSVREHIWKQR